MQSYRKRYEGHEDEIREDIRKLGLGPAQDKWGSRDYIAWRNFAEQLLPGQPVQNSTKASRLSFDEICQEIVAKLVQKIVAVEIENRELKNEIDILRNYDEIRSRQAKLAAINLLDTIS